MQRCGTCSFYFTAGLLGVLFAKEAPFIYRYIFIKTRRISHDSQLRLTVRLYTVSLQSVSRSLSRSSRAYGVPSCLYGYVCVCLYLLLLEAQKFMTKRRVRGAWRWRSNVPGSMFPGVERAHQPGPRAARAWLVSCNREASRNFNRPGGSNPVENR